VRLALERAAGMATTLRGGWMSGAEDRPLPLTVEERRALSLSAHGLVVAEVAGAMRASPEVVHVWLASAVDKLRARSKLEAVLVALRDGLIDPSP
jgi:DNA-binding NarL/FixJ family response regulator